MTLSPLVILILLLFLMVVSIIFLFWSFLTVRTTRLAPENAVQAQRQEIRKPQTRGQARPKRTHETDDFSQALNDPIPIQREPKLNSKEALKDRLSNDQSRGLNANDSSIYIPAPTVPPVEATVTKKHKPQVPRVVITETEEPKEKLEEPKAFIKEEAKALIKEEMKPKPNPEYKQSPETFEPLLLEQEKIQEDQPIKPVLEVTQEKSEIVQLQIAQPEVIRPKLKKPPKFTVIETTTAEFEQAVDADAQEATNEKQLALFDDMPTPSSPAEQEEKSDYSEDAFDRFIQSKNDDLNF